MWAICVANEWPWIPSGLLRKLRALSIARPKRARHATSRSCTSGEIRTSATSSKTSGVTVNRPTSVLPARAPSITWSDRSSVKTSESNRGLVMTSVRRSSTLSRTAVSVIAVPRWPISSLNRNFSSWSSMPGWYTGRTRAPARVHVGTTAARGTTGRTRVTRTAAPPRGGPRGSVAAVAEAVEDVRRDARHPCIGWRDAAPVRVLAEGVEGPAPLERARGDHGAARRCRVDRRGVHGGVARGVHSRLGRHDWALRPDLDARRRVGRVQRVIFLSDEADEAVPVADARPLVEPVARVDHDPVGRDAYRVAVHLADDTRFRLAHGRLPPVARRQLGVRCRDRVLRRRLVADHPAAGPQRRWLEPHLPVDAVGDEE